MSLLENESIINVYHKDKKKSIDISRRIDIFLILIILILLISPFLVNFFFRMKAEITQINLYISPHFEELLGKETVETLLLEFGEQNPDLRVRTANPAEGKNADIFIFDESEYRTLVASGSLKELNSYIYGTSVRFSTARRQLAIPLVSFMDLLFFNIDLLTAAGFDRPPKTKEEFLTYARAVSGGNEGLLENAYGTALSLSFRDGQAIPRDIFSWIWASGGDFHPEENRPFLNAAAMSADISFLGILYRERLLAPRIFDTTGDQRLEEFAQGKIAMMVASTRAIPYFRKKMGDDTFGITAIPFSGNGSGSWGKYSIGLSNIYAGIHKECEYPDEAWSFLEFLAGKSPLFCEILKAVPGVVSDIIPGDYVKNDPIYSKARDIFESSAVVQSFSGNPNSEKYENAFLEELQFLFRSNRSPQDTINAIQRRWDEIGR